MTATEALTQSRTGMAYRVLEDGRVILVFRSNPAIAYVKAPAELGYRLARSGEAIDRDLPGWVPGYQEEERTMPPRGKKRGDAHADGATERATVEFGPGDVAESAGPTSLAVAGGGAAETVAAIAEHPRAERPDVFDTGQRELLVRLEAAELADVAQQLARAFEEIEQEEADQDEQKAAMKERLAGIYARQRRLAGTLRRGVEPRLVDTRTEADYDAGLAREVRLDTGEVLSTRALTARERQMPLAPGLQARVETAMVEHAAAAEAEPKG